MPLQILQIPQTCIALIFRNPAPIHYIIKMGYSKLQNYTTNIMPIQTTSRYVIRNPQILSGEPIIIGTKTSIRAIVGLWRLGTSPEEIPIQLPHLTLAQVFDALSFYQDNQPEINDYIKRNHITDELVHPSVRERFSN